MTEQYQNINSAHPTLGPHSSQGEHWRNTQLKVMFFSFSFELFILFLLLVLVPTWTLKGTGFLIILCLIGATKIAEARGFTSTRIVKAIRTSIFSKTRPAWQRKLNRYSIDYASQPLPQGTRSLFLPAIAVICTISLFGPSPANAEFRYIAPDLLASAPVMTISGQPLKTAVRKIIPDGFTVTYGPGVSSEEKIEWQNGKPWPQALKDALRPADLEYERKGTEIIISKLPPKKPAKQIKNISKKSPATLSNNSQNNSPNNGPNNWPNNWTVKKGDKLSAVLNEWGKANKTKVRFLTDRDWLIEEDYRFIGSF